MDRRELDGGERGWRRKRLQRIFTFSIFNTLIFCVDIWVNNAHMKTVFYVIRELTLFLKTSFMIEKAFLEYSVAYLE
jgi:hypothetical protein